MKNIHALTVGLLVGGAVFGSLAVLRAEPGRVVPPSVQVGRYQLSHEQGTAWMVDTMTGDTWYRFGGKWADAGNPTTDRK